MGPHRQECPSPTPRGSRRRRRERRAPADGRGGSTRPSARSPDGRFIAYSRRDPGTDTAELWVVRAGWSQRHGQARCVAQAPSWAPDGRRGSRSRPTFAKVASTLTPSESTERTCVLSRLVRTRSSLPGLGWDRLSEGANALQFQATVSKQSSRNPKDNDSSPAWNLKTGIMYEQLRQAGQESFDWGATPAGGSSPAGRSTS